MVEAMLILGTYVFGLNTAAFQELNRNTEWRWPGQDVFDGVPALQYTGQGRDSITLPGVIFPEYWGGTGQLDALRALADTGEPQTLIDGRGFVLGDFVITGVQERQTFFAAAGVPLRQEFTITLERFSTGEVPVATGGGAGAQMAADAAATSAAAVIAADAGNTGARLTDALSEALGAVSAVVGTVATNLSGALAALNQGISAAQSIHTVGKAALETARQVGEVKDLAGAEAVLGGLSRAAAGAAQVGTAASRVVQSAVKAMEAAGDGAAAIGTVRGALVSVNRVAVESTKLRERSEGFIRGFI